MRSGDNDPLGGGSNEHPTNQIPRSYMINMIVDRVYLEFVVPFMVSYPTP
jgi:hypothetical protein